jgi:hypothetical protein
MYLEELFQSRKRLWHGNCKWEIIASLFGYLGMYEYLSQTECNGCIGGWSRTLAVIKAYGDEEHDFGIDLGVVSSLTALNIDQSKSLMKLLAKSDSGV